MAEEKVRERDAMHGNKGVRELRKNCARSG